MKGDPGGDRDRRYLEEAARLAKRGRGEVEPNPMVGALLVKDGAVLARGYHAGYGGPHAELLALQKAGSAARNSTLYVTLEPCSSQGKTPPCTDVILRAGVRCVVAGCVDPDRRHEGRGLLLLEKAGLDVRHVPEEACDELIVPFRNYLQRERPYVILKWAATLDGRIAAKDGSSRWISSERSRRSVHRLRGHVDAVMVGSRTVLMDDPRLNCRARGVPLTPARVVLDPRLEVPPSARLFQNAGDHRKVSGYPAGRIILLAGRVAAKERIDALRRAGADVILLDASTEASGPFLGEALAQLKLKGIQRLLVEGGSQLITGLIEANLADQVRVFIAPKIVGGRSAPSAVEGIGRAPMSEAIQLMHTKIKRSGEDLLIQGFFQ